MTYLILFVIIGVLLLVFRKTFLVRKTWRYVVILSPVILIITVILLRKKKPVELDKPNSSPDSLNKLLNVVKEKLHEADMITAVEVVAAKEKNAEKLNTLKQVTEIQDDQERRKRLADLLG